MLFFVATVTPFDSRGRVDLPRLRAHILWLSAVGVEGFISTASQGEFLYLSDREREAIHRTVLDTARGRPVYPCTWDPSPATTKYLTDAAKEQGASGVLMPPPLYYDIDDTLMEAWYRSVHHATELPIIAYHDPGRIRPTLSTQLYTALREDGILAGIYDSSGDIYRVQRTCEADPGAALAGGDRIMAEVAQISGAAGFVSTLANVWPSFCLRYFRGETQLDQAMADRVNRVRHAGGFRAIKALLKMGCRLPMLAPPREQWEHLPQSEHPS